MCRCEADVPSHLPPDLLQTGSGASSLTSEGWHGAAGVPLDAPYQGFRSHLVRPHIP
jgi:hypothetical protein